MTTAQHLNRQIDALAITTGRGSVLLAAAVQAGLQAGTYYTWASGVMPGLARTDDQTFVHAMQGMNVAIVNPVFLAQLPRVPRSWPGQRSRRRARLAARGRSPERPSRSARSSITGAGNIPLNNGLDAAGPVALIEDLAAVRAEFESRWVALNIARTFTATGAPRLSGLGGGPVLGVMSGEVVPSGGGESA